MRIFSWRHCYKDNKRCDKKIFKSAVASVNSSSSSSASSFIYGTWSIDPSGQIRQLSSTSSCFSRSRAGFFEVFGEGHCLQHSWLLDVIGRLDRISRLDRFGQLNKTEWFHRRGASKVNKEGVGMEAKFTE